MIDQPVIFCSDLANDQDMIASLGSCAVPIPRLFTDACFTGVGEGGIPLLVAVERKKIGDLAMCMNNGRLLRQMQLVQEHDAGVFVLIVEGVYRCGRGSGLDGLLVVPRTGRDWVPIRPVMTFSRFEQYLTELAWLAGVIVKHSDNVQRTADIIKALYTSFQKEPERHQSLRKFFLTAPSPVPLMEPGLVRRMAKELPGIGWTRSKAVSEQFPSVAAMCEADVKAWTRIPGVGKVLARRVFDALHGAD